LYEELEAQLANELGREQSVRTAAEPRTHKEGYRELLDPEEGTSAGGGGFSTTRWRDGVRTFVDDHGELTGTDYQQALDADADQAAFAAAGRAADSPVQAGPTPGSNRHRPKDCGSS